MTYARFKRLRAHGGTERAGDFGVAQRVAHHDAVTDRRAWADRAEPHGYPYAEAVNRQDANAQWKR